MKKLAVVFLALMMVATLASAQHGGGPGPEHGHGGPGGPGDLRGPGAGPLSLGSDGSIYLSKVTETAEDVYTTTITAVRPAGTVAWTATGNAAAHVIAESGTRNSDGTFTTTLNAFSASTGAAAWTKTINGRAQLVPFSGGTYA